MESRGGYSETHPPCTFLLLLFFLCLQVGEHLHEADGLGPASPGFLGAAAPQPGDLRVPAGIRGWGTPPPQPKKKLKYNKPSAHQRCPLCPARNDAETPSGRVFFQFLYKIVSGDTHTHVGGGWGARSTLRSEPSPGRSPAGPPGSVGGERGVGGGGGSDPQRVGQRNVARLSVGRSV